MCSELALWCDAELASRRAAEASVLISRRRGLFNCVVSHPQHAATSRLSILFVVA